MSVLGDRLIAMQQQKERYSFDVDGLVEYLNDKNIEARYSFKPMMMQPSFN